MSEKHRDQLLHSLGVELARAAEIMRHRDSRASEACDALIGISRQLAASEPPSDAEEDMNQRYFSYRKRKSIAKKEARARIKTERNKAKAARHLKPLLDQIVNDTGQIKHMMLAEDAAASASSEVFSEFRKSVVERAGQRRKHLTDLSFLHSLAAGAETAEEILLEAEGMFSRAGGQIVSDFNEETKQAFDVVGKGENANVLRPAYIAHNADGRVMIVARGTVELSE